MLLNFITAALLSTASSSFDQDREAILGMCGAFEVTFQFEEMTPVQADYKLKRPYEETAIEWVQLVEDRGDFISLQHILVADEDTGYVVKHWRQDWQFEDDRMMEFCGNNTWREAKSIPHKPQAVGPKRCTKPPIRLAMKPLARGSTSVNIPNGSAIAHGVRCHAANTPSVRTTTCWNPSTPTR